MLLSWLGDRAAVTGGHQRFDIRHRADAQIHASVPGFSSADAVPVSIVQQPDLIGLASNWLSQINIGANRTLGAIELMHIWWDDFRVWPADPGMAFPAPEVF